MHNRSLMSLSSAAIYDKMLDALKELRKKHRALIKKAKDKTITEDEKKLLREIIKTHNAIEKARKKIWDDHSLVKAFLGNR